MTATLVVLLIITLLAMIFLPSGRSLMKDGPSSMRFRCSM